MEKPTTETWVTPLRRPVSNSNACFIHIYPTGANMGSRYPLKDKALLIGRGEDGEIRIQDHSVSRKHARIDPRPAGGMLTDAGSPNATFVNHRLIRSTTPSPPPDYIPL